MTLAEFRDELFQQVHFARHFFFSRHFLLGVFILFQMAVCPVETDKKCFRNYALAHGGRGYLGQYLLSMCH